MSKFYITSPIFYPNATLHVGHAYTMTVCDALARWHKLQGDETFFVTGSDENAGKIAKAALAAGKDVPEFLTSITAGFKDLYAKLGISYDEFIQTTDREKHWPGATEMWKRLEAAGDIEKRTYTGLYCPQCEAFYTEKELVDGKCPLHGIEVERLEEENYFFKLSKYTDVLKQKIERGELEVLPESRKNEILALLGRGLEDVSFSRPAKTVPHAIPVPGDDSQVMYVWCDALTSYMTAVGFGTDENRYKQWWPADVHVVGKDILRFHAAIWPAMLLSAGLPLPKRIMAHGFVLSGGQKMSKSLGNTVDPVALVEEFGAEAVRYYLLRKIPSFDDGTLTHDLVKEAYNGDLANGLGNLTSRIMKLAETNLPGPVEVTPVFHETLKNYMSAFDLQRAMNHIWDEISSLDKHIQETKPWESKDKAVITDLVEKLAHIGASLAAFMPETSKKILAAIAANRLESGLFPRLQ